MPRHWLVTGTTSGTPRPSDLPATLRFAAPAAGRPSLSSPAIYFTGEQARIVAETFIASARFRDWELLAAVVLKDRFHAVVATPHLVRCDKILLELKTYASRELSARFGRPASGAWWTAGGLGRALRDERAIASAVNYLLHKHRTALHTWRPTPTPLRRAN